MGVPAEWVGLDNYVQVLTDVDGFWTVLLRSFVLMVIWVALTMLLGTLVALLMMRLNKGFRLLVSVGLLLAWAMPPLAGTIVWGWLFDTEYGVVNNFLTKITGNNWMGHPWLLDPMQFFLILTLIIVWGAVPFVAFTLYAGLTQVPGEVLEAAQLDGATPFQRFRLIMVPYVRSIYTVLIVLSIIWDLRVFTQVYALQGIGGDREKRRTRSACTSTRWAWRRGTTVSPARSPSSSSSSCSASRSTTCAGPSGRKNCEHHLHPDDPRLARRGSRARRPEDAARGTEQKRAANIVYSVIAIVVFVASAFPVYWMINTSFLPTNLIRGTDLHFFPTPDVFTLNNYVNVWTDDRRAPLPPAMVNSITVTLITLVVSMILGFLASLAITRFSFKGRKSFIVALLVIQMIPGEAMMISIFRIIDGWQMLNTITGLAFVYISAVLPFTIWTLRGFVKVCRRSSRKRP